MQKKVDPNDPSNLSHAYQHMAPSWHMIGTLMGGTRSMREAGEEFLPRHDQETSIGYQERLERTTLFNVFNLTLDSLVGRPFSRPMEISDDTPEQIRGYLDDIDLQGNDLGTFCRRWFREGLAKAFCHVLIENPRIDDENRDQRTLADDDREGIRPYWSLILPENMIAAHYQTINGVRTLVHARIYETVIEMDGFAEVIRERIRVLDQGMFTLYEKVEKRKSKRDPAWRIIDQGFTDLDVVPIVTFYADKSDDMEGKPPLEDLAYLNIRHWQSTSDQINILTVARFPMLGVAGAHNQGDRNMMTIGPRQLLGTRDPNGRFYYVEHDGKAISAGRQDLLDLEDQMTSYGAQFLKRRPGATTATSRALDTAESTSALKDMALRFNSSVQRAFEITGMWVNQDSPGRAQVHTEYDDHEVSQAELQTLLEMRSNGDLSVLDLYLELQRRGLLRADLNPSEAIAMLSRDDTAREALNEDALPQEDDDDEPDEPGSS